MIIEKNSLYRIVFYSYFLILPLAAAIESQVSGSNLAFNAFYLIVFTLIIIDLHQSRLIDNYITIFFSLSLTLLITNAIVYGFGYFNEYEPGFIEGLKISLRVLLIALISYFTFLLTYYKTINFEDLKVIAIVLLLSMIIGQAAGLSSTTEVEGAGNEFALQGLAGHVAITSSILVSILPVLFISSLRSKLSFLALMLCIVAIIFTFRRSAWLILTIMGVLHLFVIYYSRRNIFQWTKTTSILLAGSTLTGIFFLFNQDFSQAITTRLNDLNIFEGGTGAGRSVFWSILIDYIAEQPLINFFIGNGYGFIQALLDSRLNQAIGAHNDWLDIFLSFGIIPIILFITMIGLLVKDIFNQEFMLQVILTYCIANLLILSITTGGAFDTYYAFLHCTIGYALAMKANNRDSDND